jgi:streptogramin lyase
VSLASGQGFPFALAVDANNVYWTNEQDGGSVLSMPNTGGTPTTLATGCGTSRLTVDAANVYFTNPGTQNDGLVLSVPIGGGTVTTLVTGQAAPEAIVNDASSLYWVDTYLGAVMRLSPK